jgi:predicted metalloprotease with PDZ domain
MPYDRGALYFAVLNGRIVRASRGKRSIDDLIYAMMVRFRGGEEMTEAKWLDLLRAELGDAGPQTHRDMMAGKLVLPQSGDYGACFRRVVKKARVFEPGYDLRATAGDKIVRGLVAGSEAEKAGLRNGDKVVTAPFGDAMQHDHARIVTVKVTRDGQPLSFTYLPRGQSVDVYQWERTSVPEVSCR